MPDIYLVLGIVGMVLILWGFLMIQAHRWNQDQLIYDTFNFVGSVLLVIYAVVGRAWPFVVLNTIWGLYSLKDILGALIQKKVTRKAG